MTDKLEQIKKDFSRGRTTVEHIEWMIKEIERLRIVEEAYRGLKKSL